MESIAYSVSASIIISPPRNHRQNYPLPFSLQSPNSSSSLCSTSSRLFLFPLDPINSKKRINNNRLRPRSSASSGGGHEFGGGGGRDDDDDEVERALGMDGSIPRTSDEFVKRVSSRAYDMRRHLNQTLDSSSYDVLETNPWRDDTKPVYVLTHKDNQLCTMKTRQNRSEVERELGLLFSKGDKRGLGIGNKAKQSRAGINFSMLVEDIRDGVLVFEDEDDATKYCDLLQGGGRGQGCEGIAELEASSVFDICRRMRALAVLFRRGRTPPLPKSLEQNLRARKRSLEDEDIL